MAPRLYCLLLLLYHPSFAQHLVALRGRVLDHRTHQPIPAANLTIPSTRYGTSSDQHGAFVLTLPAEMAASGQKLIITCVGYQPSTKTLLSLPANQPLTILLEPATVSLQEVIVRDHPPLTAAEIVQKARNQLSKNFSRQPYLLRLFYRNYCREDTGSRLVEAKADLYDPKGHDQLYGSPQRKVALRVRQLRRSVDYTRLYDGHDYINFYGVLRQDITSYQNLLLKAGKDFSYQILDTLHEEAQPVYEIGYETSFGRQHRHPFVRRTRGKLQIGAHDFAILHYEERSDDEIYVAGDTARKTEQKSFTYRKVGDAYFLAHGVLDQQSFRMNYDAQLGKNVQKNHATHLEVRVEEVLRKDYPVFSGKLPPIGTLAQLPYDSAFWQADFTVRRYPIADDLTADLQKELPLTQQFTRMVGQVNGRQDAAPVYAFTRADTLRGTLSPLRSCFDVTYYHLDIAVEPESRSIRGSNTIHFQVTTPFRRMQLDLARDMKIDSIVYGPHRLPFEREYDAVFLQLPAELPKGSRQTVRVYYGGVPKELDPDYRWTGGFLWRKDSDGNPWVTVVCQGLGASLWWPNKDHLSDEPDSTLISVTVPPGLMNVSNGRLRRTEPLPDGRARFNWFVGYPINNYNITLNVGKYAHFRDVYVSSDTLSLDYYVLPAQLEPAKAYFAQVPRLLRTYEKLFGPYPFPRDGFKAVQSAYVGMEHQSAIAIGDDYRLDMETPDGPVRASQLLLHEVAHEWWGNSLSMGDIADMWIHEGFATYAEALYLEQHHGYAAASRYLNDMEVAGKAPIVGQVGVNHVYYRDDDMYTKGALLLHTLRHVIQDDSLWFRLLRELPARFRHQIVSTQAIIAYFNQGTGRDLTAFFQQYLYHANLPVLELAFAPRGKDWVVSYRWKAAVKDFDMPIRVTLGKLPATLIYPTTRWKKRKAILSSPGDFRVAEDQFFIQVDRTVR